MATGDTNKKSPEQLQMPPSSVLEPEYAVGVGLITADEFNAIRNEFLSQSDLSIGMVAPLIFLAFALSIWLTAWQRIGVASVVLLASIALYSMAVERRFQYRYELRILILGRWDKAQEAKKQSSGSKPSATETKQTIEVRPLTFDLRLGSTTETPAPPAKAESSTKPSKVDSGK